MLVIPGWVSLRFWPIAGQGANAAAGELSREMPGNALNDYTRRAGFPPERALEPYIYAQKSEQEGPGRTCFLLTKSSESL